MLEACASAGLPEPEIKEMQGGFQISFSKERITEEFLLKQSLNPRQITAVKYVRNKGSITNSIYQQINDVSKPTATRDLQVLVSKKILQLNGRGAGATYVLIGS